MRNWITIGICLFCLITISAQSVKKQNIVLKEQLSTARANYEKQVAQYLSDFKVLEKTRKDYRAYSKYTLNNRLNDLKRQIAEMSRLMALCDDFNMDYSTLVDQVVLNEARAFNFEIDREEEKVLLNEIYAFRNVTIALQSPDQKPKAENQFLKEQLLIYANAENENSAGIAAQQIGIEKLKKITAQLDSAEKSCYRIIIEVDKSWKRLRALTNLRYENECKVQSGTPFTFRYETEFLEKERPVSIIPTKPVELTFAEQQAEFPGGELKMQQFIKETLKLPTAITELNFQGKCYVQFTVKTTGEITDVLVLKGFPDCPDCSKEAARVVKTMPNWIPGKTDGKVLDSRVIIPITFKNN